MSDLWDMQQEQIHSWSLKTFGSKGGVESTFNHMVEEMREVLDDPTDIMEWADVLILYMDAAAHCGHTMETIREAVLEKHCINVNREWGEPDGNGVVRHVE